MSEPIYFCELEVIRFTMRGKRRIEEKSERVRMAMLTTTVDGLSDEDYSYRMLARKFLPKANRWELMDAFRKNYFVRSITVLKQVGETNDVEEEWI